MSKILELRTKRNTLWEQTKDFLEKNRGENGLVKAEAVEQYNKMAQEVKDLGSEIERLEQQAQIEAAINAQMASDDVQALISQQAAAQMASADIAALIDQQTAAQIQTLIDQNMNSPEVQDQITAALEQASSGAASISALKSQLDGYYQFYVGLQAYTGGVDSAAAGAAKLQNGAASLQNGASSLYAGASRLADGTSTLSSGASALIDGVTALRDGAMQLSDGLKQLNEEGFQKLVDAMDGDVEPLLERARALAGISGAYQTYSGLDAAMDGSVKFIYRTEAIG